MVRDDIVSIEASMSLSALSAGLPGPGVTASWPGRLEVNPTLPAEFRSGQTGDLRSGRAGEDGAWEAVSRRPRSFFSRRRRQPPLRPLTGQRPLLARRRGYPPPTAAPLPATTSTTTSPPVVWFPDLSDECEKPAKSSSAFNAFGFLAFVLSAVNLVSLLSSNVNNNINNNNNNNNNNDNNDINTNEDNANTNQNVLNQVMISPGRRRRSPTREERTHTQTTPANQSRTSPRDSNHLVNTETYRETELHPEVDPAEVSLLVVLSVLTAWREAVLTGDLCCTLRALCDAGVQSRKLGPLGDTLIEVLR